MAPWPKYCSLGYSGALGRARGSSGFHRFPHSVTFHIRCSFWLCDFSELNTRTVQLLFNDFHPSFHDFSLLSFGTPYRRKCDVDREPRDLTAAAAAAARSFFPASISTTTPGTPNSIQIKISTSPDISPTALSNSSSLSPPMSVANMMPTSGTPTTAGPISSSSSVSPAISVAGNYLHTSSHKQSMSGIPCVAAASRYTAPVHIDVGGTIYTSSLETLTK